MEKNNRYFGKQFSVLGDSISTLAGFNPRGYTVFYKGEFSGDEKSYKANVHEMKDTWWGKVIDFFGGELLVNNSWSGSRVTKLPQNDNLFPSGCSDERTGGLHINNVMPDVIIVYLGINDWAFGALRNDETRVLPINEMECFESAYNEMLRKLKRNYPKAEIWCCTLCSTKMSGNPSFSFPDSYNGNDVNYYNDAIRNIIDINNCKLIDLYANQLPYDSIDGTHPNADGMNTLAVQIIRAMCDDKGASFLDCKTEAEHDYIRLDGYYDIMKYKCKKCGKGKIEDAYRCLDWDTNVTEDKQTNNKYFCNKCGAAVNEEDIFCSKCGNHLKTKDASLIYDSDAEYVFLPPDRTTPLDGFGNKIKNCLKGLFGKKKNTKPSEEVIEQQEPKLKLVQCEVGHYYNAAKYSECPHCKSYPYNKQNDYKDIPCVYASPDIMNKD